MLSQDLLISIGCIATTCLLSQLARNKLSDRFPNGILGILTTEFVAMFELCATCYELGIVIEFHGIAVYFQVLFLLCLWRSFYWRNVTACPYSYVEEWLNGKFHAASVLAITLAQLVGGSLVYNYYTKSFWSFEFRDAHKGRFDSLQCKSDVQVLPLYAGLTETFAVFVCLITVKAFTLVTNTLFCNIIISFVVSCLVCGALGISGGYMNPALASILQHGCSGSTFLEQFLVYWVGNTGGAVLAYYFWNYAQSHRTLKIPPGPEDTQKLKRG